MLLFENALVPYYEARIEQLDLVGAKKIAALKAAGTYDPHNLAHVHQRVVFKWDVYAVHREAKTREWIKENYDWILLLFVPASTTKKLQELDVGCNSTIQTGCKTKINALQIERLE